MTTTLVPASELINIPTNDNDLALYVAEALAYIPLAAEVPELLTAKRVAEVVRADVARNMSGRGPEFMAAQVSRRIERRLGQLIREGQAKGTVAVHGMRPDRAGGKTFVRDWITDSHERADIYLMSSVDDAAFELAMTEALAERNVSRTNVARRIKAKVPVVPKAPPTRRPIRNNPLRYRAPRFDANHIVKETAMTLEGLAMGLDLVDKTTVDTAVAAEWSTSITTSARAFARFAKEIQHG
jgi:hypothetical protein